MFRVPVKVPPARGSLVAIEFVNVVDKAASFPRAVAISLRVSKAPGALATRLDTAVVIAEFLLETSVAIAEDRADDAAELAEAKVAASPAIRDVASAAIASVTDTPSPTQAVPLYQRSSLFVVLK
jgi:hypothetical protein